MKKKKKLRSVDKEDVEINSIAKDEIDILCEGITEGVKTVMVTCGRIARAFTDGVEQAEQELKDS